MRTVDTSLSVGETIELPTELRHSKLVGSGSPRLLAVGSDDTREYVVGKSSIGNDLDEFPDTVEVLGIADGAGFGGYNVWLAIPVEEYDR